MLDNTDVLALRAFCEELEKRAVSVGLLQRYLARRAEQGIGGARALGRDVAAAAARGATTAREAIGMGGGQSRYLMGAVSEGGRDLRRLERDLRPWRARQDIQANIRAAESLPFEERYNLSKPITVEYEGEVPYAYSSKYMNTLFSARPEVHDPRGLLSQATATAVSGPPRRSGPRAIRAAGVPAGWGSSSAPDAVTVARKRRPMPAAMGV